MPTLEQVRHQHVADLDQALESIVGQLRAMEEVQKVILFGSWARGRRDLCSDLDLIVVMDSPLDFVARCVDLAGRLRTGAPLDLLVYTPREFAHMEGRSFLRLAVAEGQVLYAR